MQLNFLSLLKLLALLLNLTLTYSIIEIILITEPQFRFKLVMLIPLILIIMLLIHLTFVKLRRVASLLLAGICGLGVFDVLTSPVGKIDIYLCVIFVMMVFSFILSGRGEDWKIEQAQQNLAR